jgi:D-arabinose 1-dehydrogenase-like Zn-dependent alcohol dehydrogenase
MRTVVMREFGPPEVLEPAEVDEVNGGQAGPGEVVIEVELANVTFIETQVRAGRPPHPSMFPALPAILGNGVGGTVTGGRQVVASLNGTGGYAERAVVPAARLIEVPDGVSLRDAVALLADGLGLGGRGNGWAWTEVVRSDDFDLAPRSGGVRRSRPTCRLTTSAADRGRKSVGGDGNPGSGR